MAATGCMNRVFGGLLVAVALMAHCSTAQTTHIVGGSTGWALPSNPTSYSTWASQQTFRVGDSLTFNFATSRHDVTTVTQTAYDACDASSPIGPIQTAAPVTIRLTTPGPQYYLCSFEGHCSLGQKLSINVVAAASPPPTAATAPPPTAVATPPTTSVVPPTAVATPPTTSAVPPTAVATPPATSAVPPTAVATPPTTSAVPPTLPPPTSSPPPTIVATSPTTFATPPTTSTVPPPTAGGPPSSPASRLVAAGLSATLFSFAVALMM